MPANSTHPEYDAAATEWSRARDVLAGEDAVKAGGENYLPRLDSQTDEEFAAYVKRASFFNATARTSEAYQGLIFRRPPFVKLPEGGSGLGKAMQEFREPWRARLGFPSRAAISSVHWARIKALTRRLGELGQDEYDTLRPVADMIARLSEHISTFLSMPVRWEPGQPTEEKQQLAIDGIERRVFSSLREYAKTRMFLNRVKDWGQAYSHRGTGSTFKRATEVERIYEWATPIPNETPDPQAMELIREVRRLVRDAVKEGGGKLVTES
jgi:hypothetical protein